MSCLQTEIWRRKTGSPGGRDRGGGGVGVWGVWGGGGVRRERSGKSSPFKYHAVFIQIMWLRNKSRICLPILSSRCCLIGICFFVLATNKRKNKKRTSKQRKTNKKQQNTNNNNNKTKETKTVSLRRANISDKAAHFDLQNNDFCVRQFLHFIPSLCPEDVKSDVL